MTTPIKLGAVARCVVRYFRTGDMESSLALLGATPAARQAARSAIVSLPIVSAKASPGSPGDDSSHAIFSVPARDDRARLEVGSKSIDTKLIQILLDQVRRESDKQAKIHSGFWKLMLEDVDTTDMVIRCRTVNELQTLVTGACRYLKGCEEFLGPALVASLAIDDAVFASELDKYPTLGTLPIKKMQFSKQECAYLPVAFTLLTRGSQRRLSSFLLVAASRSVWNTVALDTPQNAG